ncbi:FemAB family XrtA/PEP-CTERM system-associated protein [Rhodopila sp.]|uniref:FemAB family XrtA/PEP-CTERM system-associated protein n=1 Tax=Rhodopila sp. TaxID=2480087 RepID=UPI003D0C94E4
MSIVLRGLNDGNAAAWDRFVNAMPAGTFFHRSGWARVVETAFGHVTHYVLAERDGAITGVLPLARVKTRLFGDTLISNPFCVYGGPLAADAESAAALAAEAEALRARTGASAVEFRHREPIGNDGLEDTWIERPDLYVTFRRPIEADHERNMKAIPRKQRAMVRKGIQNGLTSVVDRNVDGLHKVYAESVRNLGTPVFSRRYFRILMNVFGDAADVVTILHKDAPVAAVMNFYFREEVLPYYGGGSLAARACAGNDFMYWEVMRRAAERGSRLFDFGRSKIGTGAYAFKHNWGFAPEKLHYRYGLAPGASIPEHNPMNPKYRLFIAAWKRLPLPVANMLGPFIVRGLG